MKTSLPNPSSPTLPHRIPCHCGGRCPVSTRTLQCPERASRGRTLPPVTPPTAWAAKGKAAPTASWWSGVSACRSGDCLQGSGRASIGASPRTTSMIRGRERASSRMTPMSSRTALSKCQMCSSYLRNVVYPRKYCLPSTVNEKHPELRTINCHTLADVLQGKHSGSIKSFRYDDTYCSLS